MANRRKSALGLIAAHALLLFLAACASQRPEGTSQEADAKIEAQLRAGNGFICGYNPDNGKGACVCDWAELDPEEVLHCKGMGSLCSRLGGTSECDDEICMCRFRL